MTVTETSQSIADNYTDLNYSVTLYNGVQNFSGYTIGYDVYINGEQVAYQYNSGNQTSMSAYSSKLVVSGTKRIYHDADGSKNNMAVSVRIFTNNISYLPVELNASGTMNLTQIPRQATITSAPNFNDEENPTITYSNPAGTAVTSLMTCISWTGGADITYRNIPMNGTSYTYNFTDAERITLRNACTTNSMTVTFYVRTVIGGNTYYSTLVRTFSIINGNPVFGNFTYKDTNATVTAITENDQVLIKGLSTLQATISSANKMVAQKQATAKNYVATIDGKTASANYSTADLNIDLGTVNSSGTKRLSIRAYDSRNNSTEAHKDITIYDYAKPVLNASAMRLNNFENQTTITVAGTYTLLNINNVNKNNINKIQYRYRETNGEWSGLTDMTITLNNNTFTCDNVLLSLDNTKSFEIEINATDNLRTTTVKLIVDVGQAIFFISSNKKKCYINGEEVVVSKDSKKHKYFSGLSDSVLDDIPTLLGEDYISAKPYSLYFNPPTTNSLYGGLAFLIEGVYIDGGFGFQTAYSYDSKNSIKKRSQWNGVWTEWVIVQTQRKVLYDNSSGSNGTITLSDSVANYDSIEIFFRNNDMNYDSIKILNAHDKGATLCCHTATINGTSYHKEKSVYIGGTNISLRATNSFNEYVVSTGGLTGFNNVDLIYITKVIGYN